MIAHPKHTSIRTTSCTYPRLPNLVFSDILSFSDRQPAVGELPIIVALFSLVVDATCVSLSLHLVVEIRLICFGRSHAHSSGFPISRPQFSVSYYALSNIHGPSTLSHSEGSSQTLRAPIIDGLAGQLEATPRQPACSSNEVSSMGSTRGRPDPARRGSRLSMLEVGISS